MRQRRGLTEPMVNRSESDLNEPSSLRWMLLVLSISFVGLGGIWRLIPGLEESSRMFLSGTLLKVGMVLGLGWLAAPQLERLGWNRLRGTGLAILAAIGVLTALRPKFGAIAAGFVVGGVCVLAVLGWVRGVIFNDSRVGSTSGKTSKIEKNPTRRSP